LQLANNPVCNSSSFFRKNKIANNLENHEDRQLVRLVLRS
jgi:hypothetical protein